MLTLLTAGAGMLSAPEMLPIQDYFPSDELRQKISSAALLEIVVDPEGKRVSCSTLAVFGHERMANDICKYQYRATFRPARSASGEASYGVVRALIKYVVAGTSEGDEINRLDAPRITHEIIGARVKAGRRFPSVDSTLSRHFVALPDMIFEVRALPGVEHEFVDVRLTVSIDVGGAVNDCAPFGDVEASSKHSDYAAAACKQLGGRQVTEPLVIGKEPVAHIRTLEVRFALSENL